MIGASLLVIKEKNNTYSGCQVGYWTLGVQISISNAKCRAKGLAEGLRKKFGKIIDEWHLDDEKVKKIEFKTLEDVKKVRKQYDVVTILERDGWWHDGKKETIEEITKG